MDLVGGMNWIISFVCCVIFGCFIFLVEFVNVLIDCGFVIVVGFSDCFN